MRHHTSERCLRERAHLQKAYVPHRPHENINTKEEAYEILSLASKQGTMKDPTQSGARARTENAGKKAGTGYGVHAPRLRTLLSPRPTTLAAPEEELVVKDAARSLVSVDVVAALGVKLFALRDVQEFAQDLVGGN